MHEGDWFEDKGTSGGLSNGHLVFVRELKRTCKVNGNPVDLEEVSRAIRGDKEVTEAHVSYGEVGSLRRLGLAGRSCWKKRQKSCGRTLRRIWQGTRFQDNSRFWNEIGFGGSGKRRDG